MAYARYTVSTELSPAASVTSERRATAPEAGLRTCAFQAEPERVTGADFQVLPPSVEGQTRQDLGVTLVNFASGPWEPRSGLTVTAVVLPAAAWLRLFRPSGTKLVRNTG